MIILIKSEGWKKDAGEGRGSGWSKSLSAQVCKPRGEELETRNGLLMWRVIAWTMLELSGLGTCQAGTFA